MLNLATVNRRRDLRCPTHRRRVDFVLVVKVGFGSRVLPCDVVFVTGKVDRGHHHFDVFWLCRGHHFVFRVVSTTISESAVGRRKTRRQLSARPPCSVCSL